MNIVLAKTYLTKTAFLFILLSCLISCNPDHTHTAAEKKYKFALHPESGTQYYCTINNATDINLELQNKKTGNKNKITVGLIYEINKDSAGNTAFKITYDSFHVAINKDDITTEYDASNGIYSINPIEKMLAVLKGNSLLITVSSQGKILSVNGYQEIANKLIEQMQINDITEKQEIQNQLSSMAGEGFVKNNLEQSFTIFPDTAVYINDTWTKTLTASTELGLNLSTLYTLSSVNDDIAEIKSSSQINTNNQNINIIGSQATASLKGSEKGHLKINVNTGMLQEAESKVSIKGDIQVMQKNVPVTITITKRIEVRMI